MRDSLIFREQTLSFFQNQQQWVSTEEDSLRFVPIQLQSVRGSMNKSYDMVIKICV